ncbi:MAG: hypothetical protein H0U97_09595 [Gammaproteobacteria bacterium]|nr:hypothetical protein [Gammaproteobacteria bacterium]
MYVRVLERLGQSQGIEEQKRGIKELGSRLALAKEKIEKPFNPFLGEVLPQGVLRRAGLKTTTRADNKTPMLIQTALEQSLVLRPFIATKLTEITSAKNFFHYGPDPVEFNYKYLKLHKIVIPFGSKEEKELLKIRGFYHRRIWARSELSDFLPIHVAIGC